jgi:ribosomal protein S18 acetylase RimI-like enzyme
MTQLSLRIRPALAADADSIGRMAQQFAAYLRTLGDTTDFQFDAQAYLRDGFGPRPAFFGFVAEINDQIVGYLLYHHGYDTDHAVRLLQIIDLYVEESMRGQGAGRALMEAAVSIGRQEEARWLLWSVYHRNKTAIDFYQRLGARFLEDIDFMYLEID